MTFEQIRHWAEHVRRIPLKTVLTTLGAQTDRYDKNKWHTEQGTLSVTGTKFFNWNQGKSGGGAIDLAMHLNNQNFKAAVKWLWFHFPGTPFAHLPQPISKSTLQLPPNNVSNLPQIRRYLNKKRRLPSSLLDPLIKAGTLYADNRANAVFLLLGKKNRPVGAELRGTTAKNWRGLAKGSNKNQGYFSVHPPKYKTIILCESAIDALSCFALHPHSCTISTAGARPNPSWLASLVTDSHYQIYCGFDNDQTGQNMAEAMTHRYPSIKRICPPKHDWNDALRPSS